MSFGQYMYENTVPADDKTPIKMLQNTATNCSQRGSSMFSVVKLNKCPFCNKIFHRADSMKTHIRIHTGEKPYKCDICNRRFTQSHHVKEHRRRKHSDLYMNI